MPMSSARRLARLASHLATKSADVAPPPDARAPAEIPSSIWAEQGGAPSITRFDTLFAGGFEIVTAAATSSLADRDEEGFLDLHASKPELGEKCALTADQLATYHGRGWVTPEQFRVPPHIIEHIKEDHARFVHRWEQSHPEVREPRLCLSLSFSVSLADGRR